MSRQVTITDEELWKGLPGGQTAFLEDWEHWAVALEGGWGGGKALALDTPLPTPAGWTTMGEVQPGDILFAADGTPCSIANATPVMYGHDCYCVSFWDGTDVIADAEHQWYVIDWPYKSFAHLTTTSIARGIGNGRSYAIHNWWLEGPTVDRWHIKSVEPVPSVPVRCITVDSPNHLFLCSRSMIPTHNSWSGARKLLTLHIYNAFDKGGNPTYVWSAVIAPTYANASDFCVPAIEEACSDIGLTAEYKSGKQEFIFPDLGTAKQPSKIIVRTGDKPERITGWQVGAAWGDEAARWKMDRHDPKNDAYLQLTGRVRHPKARLCQLMLTYTNEGDGTRVYEEFHAGHPTHALYRASTWDNPHVREHAERQAALLSPDLQVQYLEGGSMSLRGRNMYSQFDAAVHLDDTLKLTDALPLQMSLDFNIAPGMHALIGHYDELRDIFGTVHEIHELRLDVRGVVQQFAEFVQQQGGWKWPGPLEVFGDATGGSQWAGTGETCYQILANGLELAGIPFRIRVGRSNPPIVDRINAVNSALKDMKGGIHWKIHPRCERLVADLRQMRYDENGEPDKKAHALSHASEAEGYRIHYLRPIRKLFNRVPGRVSVVAG